MSAAITATEDECFEFIRRDDRLDTGEDFLAGAGEMVFQGIAAVEGEAVKLGTSNIEGLLLVSPETCLSMNPLTLALSPKGEREVELRVRTHLLRLWSRGLGACRWDVGAPRSISVSVKFPAFAEAGEFGATLLPADARSVWHFA